MFSFAKVTLCFAVIAAANAAPQRRPLFRDEFQIEASEIRERRADSDNGFFLFRDASDEEPYAKDAPFNFRPKSNRPRLTVRQSTQPEFFPLALNPSDKARNSSDLTKPGNQKAMPTLITPLTTPRHKLNTIHPPSSSVSGNTVCNPFPPYYFAYPKSVILVDNQRQ